jgi:hypothetical protein
MATLGNKVATQHVSLQKQTITGNGGTSYSLQQSVGSALDIAVFVNNTRQEPVTAYSASGTTLTMTGAVNASDHFYVLFLGKAITTTGLPVDAVATANINAGAVDLTSKVSGVLPTARGGTGDTAGSGMVKLYSLTSSDTVAAHDISSTYVNSTYDHYKVIGYFEGDADTRYLYMQVFVGGVVQTGSIYASAASGLDGADYENNNSATSLIIATVTGMGGEDGEGTNVSMTFQHANNTRAPFSVTGISNKFHSNGNHGGSAFNGSLLPANRADVVNGLRFKMHSGNISYASFTLYGLK